jgi:four helix bundle protein
MGYRQLKVYEKSYKSALAVYRMTERFPREEIYGMTSQIRKAATSIPLNIAEGYAKRESQKEFKRFITMALGSSDEMQVLLEFAKDLGYIDKEIYSRAKAEYQEISRMLNGMLRRVKSEI